MDGREQTGWHKCEIIKTFKTNEKYKSVRTTNHKYISNVIIKEKKKDRPQKTLSK